jgi:hypothetical protein
MPAWARCCKASSGTQGKRYNGRSHYANAACGRYFLFNQAGV